MSALTPELLKKIRKIQIETTHLAQDVLAGAYKSAFKGRGIEFEEVREYQPGDEVRSIDWNVTARMSKPYVKTFREERELTVHLLVDISASTAFGSNPEEKKRRIMTEIGAVLAFSAIKNNDKIGLMLFTDQVELYLPPKKGLRHVLRVVRELLAFTPKHKGTDIGTALAYLGTVQTKAGVCFVISDFLNSQFSRELKIISKRNDLICIAISDPFEQQFPNLGLVQMEDLESSKAAVIDTANLKMAYKDALQRRKNTFNQLIKSTGIGLIEIATDKPYMPALRRFFKLREAHR